MNLHRSLKKSIAASLALAMLTVPLAGCGSNRGLTTGGMSGKGILGDFLAGGLYGGVMGGFLRPEEPLPKGAFVLELPRANDDRQVVELLGMDALRYYVHARIATERLSRMNAQNSKPEAYAKLLKETADLWMLAEKFSDMAQQFAQKLAEKEKKPGYKPLAMIDRSPFGADIFFSVAYAREGTAQDEAGHAPVDRSDRERIEQSAAWSKDIVRAYEKFPAGKGIEGLSKTLGVDAKEANRQFQKAVKNLDRDTLLGVDQKKMAQLYNVGAKTAMTTRVACKAALLVGGAILTGGATGTAATVGVVNTLASGADLVIEVSNTALELMTDKTDPTLDKIQQHTGSIAAITSLGTLATSYGDFALKGEKAVAATQQALKNAGLQNTKGLLDQFDKGGSGISLLADTASWSVDRGLEVSDGKILGFSAIQKDGKTVIVPGDMGQGVYGPPTPLDQLGATALDALYGPKEAEARAEAIKELTKIVEKLEKEKHEALQKAAKEAEKEKKKLEQAKRNAPFATSKLAGYYSVKSASKDSLVTVEGGVIHAIDDTTIRCSEVLGEKDTTSTPEIFTATIDPMTGHGVTSEGYSIQFQQSGASYSCTFQNVWGTWRAYKY